MADPVISSIRRMLMSDIKKLDQKLLECFYLDEEDFDEDELNDGDYTWISWRYPFRSNLYR